MNLLSADNSEQNRRAGPGVRLRILTLVGALALVAAACSSASPTSDTAVPGDPQTATTGSATSAAPAADTEPVCEQSSMLDVVDVDAVAAIPLAEAADGLSELGADEVAQLLDELQAQELNLCTLEVSPWVAAAIAEIDQAAAAGDRDEVRRLLEQLIRTDLSAWAPMAVGISASDGTDHQQRARDALEAAEKAYENGEDDLGDDAINEAAREYKEYVKEKMGQTNDPRTLLEMAAILQMLGEDELSEELIAKILEIFEKELAEVVARYDACNPTLDESRELVIATARVAMFDGASAAGEAKIMERVDIIERREKGEPVPECDSYTFTAQSPFAGWDGEMTLDLATCDGLTWTGMMTVDAKMTVPGGSFTTTGYADLDITFPSMKSTAEASLTATQYIVMKIPGGSGTIDGEGPGTLKMTVDGEAGTAKATIVVDSLVATVVVSASGRTASMTTTVAGGTSTFEGALTRQSPCNEGG